MKFPMVSSWNQYFQVHTQKLEIIKGFTTYCLLTVKIQPRDTSRNIMKRTFGHVRPVKILIRLRMRAVWSESSLGASWIAKGAKFLHADNEDSDQTARLRRLIWVFVGRTCEKVRFLTLRRIQYEDYRSKMAFMPWLNNDRRDPSAHPCSYQEFYHSSTCSTAAKNRAGWVEQCQLRSECANAQASLGLRSLHMRWRVC